jgi:hypothetical protein
MRKKERKGKKLVNLHGSTSLFTQYKKQEKERNKSQTKMIRKNNRPFS